MEKKMKGRYKVEMWCNSVDLESDDESDIIDCSDDGEADSRLARVCQRIQKT